MPKPPELSPEQREYVKLVVTGPFKDSAVTVFRDGMFPSVIQAMLEGSDNIVFARNRLGGKTTQVIFNVAPDRISISGIGESGMDNEGLKKMFRVGETTGEGGNTRGVGVKFMAWALAFDLQVIAKKEGDPNEWTFDESGFGDPKVDYSGNRPITSRLVSDQDIGRVDTILTDLKVKEKDMPGGAQLRRALGEVYRPLLAGEEVKFNRAGNPKLTPRKIINREGNPELANDRFVGWVISGKKAKQAFPLEIPLQDGCTEDLKIAVVEDEGGDESQPELIPYWIGQKDTSNPLAALVDPGIRLYYDGRLIQKREGLGVIDFRDPRLSQVVGEAHVDYVKGIKDGLMMNKSHGIAEDSSAWQRAKSALAQAVFPYIEELKKKPMKPTLAFSNELFQVLAKSKRFMSIVMGDILSDEVIAENLMHGGRLGVTHGQTPPVRSGTQEDVRDSIEPLGVQGKTWNDQEARTFPGRKSDPQIPRRRKGLAHEINLRDFEAGDKRFSAMVIDGSGSSQRRTIQINSAHPDIQGIFEESQVNPDDAAYHLLTLVNRELAHYMAKEAGKEDQEAVERFMVEATYALGSLALQDPTLDKIRIKGLQQSSRGESKRK